MWTNAVQGDMVPIGPCGPLVPWTGGQTHFFTCLGALSNGMIVCLMIPDSQKGWTKVNHKQSSCEQIMTIITTSTSILLIINSLPLSILEDEGDILG